MWMASRWRDRCEADTRLAGVKVIMLTSAGLPHGRSRAPSISAQLIKPVKHSDLLDAILNAFVPGVAPSARAERRPRPRATGRSGRSASSWPRTTPPTRSSSSCCSRGADTVSRRSNDGRQAVVEGDRARYDVILMDVQMPEMGGFEATAASGAMSARPAGTPPIVAMTAHAMAGDRERCLAAGMDDYVSKPIRAEELLGTIDRIGGQAAGEEPGRPKRHPAPARASAPPPRDRHAGNRRRERVRAAHRPRARCSPASAATSTLLREVVSVFLADTPKQVAALDAAVRSRDAAAIAASAHALKGSAGLFSKAGPYDAARALEQAARQGRSGRDRSRLRRREAGSGATRKRVAIAAGPVTSAARPSPAFGILHQWHRGQSSARRVIARRLSWPPGGQPHSFDYAGGVTRTVTRSDHSLVRGLGLFAATSIVVGGVIGTGVFLKARVMTCNVDTPGMVIAVWVVAGLLSLAGRADLRRARGDDAARRRRVRVHPRGLWAALGLPLRLDAILRRQHRRAGRARGRLRHLPEHAERRRSRVARISLRLGSDLASWRAWWRSRPLVVTLVNCAAVSVGGRVASVMAALKVLLVVGVGVGAFLLADGRLGALCAVGRPAPARASLPAARGGFAGFGAAMLAALWAYNGWNEVTFVAGEVEEPAARPCRSRSSAASLILARALRLRERRRTSMCSRRPRSPASRTRPPSRPKWSRSFSGRALAALMAAALAMSVFGALRSSSLVGARCRMPWPPTASSSRRSRMLSPRTRVPVRALLAQARLGHRARLLRLVRHADRLRHFRRADLRGARHCVRLRRSGAGSPMPSGRTGPGAIRSCRPVPAGRRRG